MSCQHAPSGLQDMLNEVWGNNQQTADSKRQQTSALPIIDGGLHTIGTLPPVVNPDSKKLSPFQFAKRIESVLDDYVRPMLRRDGGDLELIDIKDMNIYVELRGTCAACASASQTLKHLVERTLKEQVDGDIRVIQV